MPLKQFSFFLLCFILLTFSPVARSQRVETAKNMEIEQVKSSNSQLFVIAEAYRLTSEDKVFSGPSFGLGYDYEMSSRWSVGLEVKHAYSIQQLKGLYLSTVFKFRYALTGEFLNENERVRIKSWPVLESEKLAVSGFRIDAGVVNYSIFAAQSEVPFSGFGFGVSYEKYLQKKWSVEPGVSFDATSNSRQSVFAMRGALRIKYRL